MVYDCVTLNGQPSCPVAGGQWEACATSNDDSTTSGSSTTSSTSTGQDLDLSAAADGSTLALAGGSLPRITAGGQACLFPFVYKGRRYDDCVMTEAGSEQCAAGDGRLLDCLPVVSLPVNETTCEDDGTGNGTAVVLGGAVLQSLDPSAGGWEGLVMGQCRAECRDRNSAGTVQG